MHVCVCSVLKFTLFGSLARLCKMNSLANTCGCPLHNAYIQYNTIPSHFYYKKLYSYMARSSRYDIDNIIRNSF